jgi:hypothetical protein
VECARFAAAMSFFDNLSRNEPMPLRDPFAVYNAAGNLEAVFVRDALIDAGVEAFVIEDVSQVGTWVDGHVPEIHKPQVWVERADIERARPVLDAFEKRKADLRSASTAQADGPAIEAVCEECGGHAMFPAAQRGSVQQCPHCNAYLDVGDEDAPGDWGEDEADADKP